MRFKKNCLNCAFCIRRKRYWIAHHFKPELSKWKDEDFNLSNNEIEKIKSNDFSFLGEEKRKQNEWIKQYEEKEKKSKEENDKLSETNPILKTLGININNFSNFYMDPFQNDPYPYIEQFGMDKIPEAPDNDYLMCWKGQWNFRDEINNKIKLKNCKCPFFYNKKNVGNKTFNACNEDMERKMRIDETIKYGIVGGIFIGIIIWFITDHIFK